MLKYIYLAGPILNRANTEILYLELDSLLFFGLADTDAKMIQELNTFGYFKYIFLTVFGKGFGDRLQRST